VGKKRKKAGTRKSKKKLKKGLLKKGAQKTALKEMVPMAARKTKCCDKLQKGGIQECSRCPLLLNLMHERLNLYHLPPTLHYAI